MDNIIKFPTDYKGSEIINSRKNIEEITKLSDHQTLVYQAKEEGINYRDLRAKLRLHNISLEQAIENCKLGISTSEYLRQREEKRKYEELTLRKTQRMLKTYFATAITASFLILGFSIYQELTELIEKETNCYEFTTKPITITDPEMKEKLEEYKTNCYPKIIPGT
ncbi:hypothetical protein J4440_06705 [Candidatus Woesearchaeota archaeon]|nr:hypothetical protein [Candidatus Woesearchaeota archaeon]